ncbi:MAG TPA: hypothetical protein PLF80_14485 [Flavobacteriales bacterium]|nr:hypothetical protein [Flavobacteriales bacterium]
MKFVQRNDGIAFAVVLLSVLLSAPRANAQEHEAQEAGEEGRHELSVLIAHGHVGQGLNAEGGRRWLVLPAWGLNYNYWLNERWALGLHTDLINENFVVEEFDEEVLERERPIAPALMATYRPHEHWSFLLGAGMEFAPGDDLTLIRGGAEYTVHLGGTWETCASLAYDLRLDAYDSWTLGIGLARRF